MKAKHWVGKSKTNKFEILKIFTDFFLLNFVCLFGKKMFTECGKCTWYYKQFIDKDADIRADNWTQKF